MSQFDPKKIIRAIINKPNIVLRRNEDTYDRAEYAMEAMETLLMLKAPDFRRRCLPRAELNVLDIIDIAEAAIRTRKLLEVDAFLLRKTGRPLEGS